VLLAGVAACAVTPAGEARGPSDIRIDRQTVLRLPQGLVFVPPEPGDPDLLGTVLARYGRVTQRLVLFAASRDENGIPEVEAAGWRR
jgi:uncharacterized membrane-anchored protein